MSSYFLVGKLGVWAFLPILKFSFLGGWGLLTQKVCHEEFEGHPLSEVANLSTTSINASCVCVLRLLWVKAAEFSQENWYPPRQCGNFQIKATKSVIQYQQDQESGQNQASPDWEGRKWSWSWLIIFSFSYHYHYFHFIWTRGVFVLYFCIDTNDLDSWKG